MSNDHASSNSKDVAGPWNILLVTEGLVDQKLLQGLLTKHHHHVIAANDGRKALSLSSENHFDVVILDAILPEMDGAELVCEIRKLEGELRRVSIIVLTDEESDGDRCLRAGADACLSRPLQIAEFHDCVRAARQSDSAGVRDPVADPDSIDWQVALDAVGGRRDLLAELVDIFGTEYPATLTAIQAAIDHQDSKRLQMSAHQLKGCLRYFGTTTASELARKLEDIGRSGQMDGASNMIDPLRNAVDRLLPQLRKGPD